jgi:hypothetical protein
MLQALNGDICMYAPQEPHAAMKITANAGKLIYVIMATTKE